MSTTNNPTPNNPTPNNQPQPPAAPPAPAGSGGNVGSAPSPAQAIAQVQTDVQSDITTIKNATFALATQAVADYQQLTEASKGKFHQLLNDLETAEQVSLGSLHTLFGAK